MKLVFSNDNPPLIHINDDRDYISLLEENKVF